MRKCFDETGLEIEIRDPLDAIAGREHGNAGVIIVRRARSVGDKQLRDYLEAADDLDRVAFFARGNCRPWPFLLLRRLSTGGSGPPQPTRLQRCDLPA